MKKAKILIILFAAFFTVFVSSCTTDPYSKLLIQGKKHENAGEYEKAWEKYAEAVESDKNREEAYLSLAGLSQKRGMYVYTAALAEKLISLNPQNLDAYMIYMRTALICNEADHICEKAKMAIDSGCDEKAVRNFLYDAVNRLDDGQASIIYEFLGESEKALDAKKQLAVSYAKSRDYEKAIQIYDELGDTRMGNVTRYSWAHNLIEEKHYREAYRLLAQFQDYDDAHRLLINNIVSRCNDALKGASGSIASDLPLWSELEDAGLVEAAAEAKCLIAKNYLEEGDYSKAMLLLDSVQDNTAAAQFLHDTVVEYAGELRQKEEFDTALALYGYIDDKEEQKELMIQTKTEKAEILLENGSWEDAIVLYQEIGTPETLEKKDVLLEDKAASAMASARYEDAVRYYEQMSMDYPGREGLEEAKYCHGKALLEAGKSKAAWSIFSDIPEYRDSGDILRDSVLQSAEDALHNGQYDEAIDAYAFLQDPDEMQENTDSARYQWGKALLGEGHFSQARTELQKIKDYKDSAVLINDLTPAFFLSEKEIGDTFVFGKFQYSQERGKEPISWKILEKDHGKMLITTEYSLTTMQFSNSSSEICEWEKSSLRTWLNNDFIEQAFTDAERDLILQVQVKNEDTRFFHDGRGSDTYDRIFIPSYSEIQKYFGTDPKKLILEDGDEKRRKDPWFGGSTSWWLRTPGNYTNHLLWVEYNGEIDMQGAESTHMYLSVRPMMVIDIQLPAVYEELKLYDTDPHERDRLISEEVQAHVAGDDYPSARMMAGSLSDPEEKAALIAQIDKAENEYITALKISEKEAWANRVIDFSGAKVGDRVEFGRWEQDNNTGAGPENITWIVIAKEEDQLLLLSETCLEHMPYCEAYPREGYVTWASSSLRNWLNGDFYQAAFSDKEKASIIISHNNSYNYSYDASAISQTEDNVFLLSADEAMQFLKDDTILHAKYSIKAFVDSDSFHEDQDSLRAFWWLRDIGEVGNWARYVSCFIWEGINNGGWEGTGKIGVRPAIRVQLSSDPNSPAGTPLAKNQSYQ